jgi:hypothetical protein
MPSRILFKWTCPFCDENATILDSNYHREVDVFAHMIGEKIALVNEIIECPNPDCSKYQLTVSLYDTYGTSEGPMGAMVTKAGANLIKKWLLIPPSQAKSFPDYIPEPIVQNYEEACLIKDLSPKASATMSRRCLQGIIRDFWGIIKDNLKNEIEAIKNKCDPLTWEAIDSTRKIGNIGAHFEKDVNLIVDIEPKEAERLINLIEVLFRDWYINKHEKEERLKNIVEISKKKEDKKKGKVS